MERTGRVVGGGNGGGGNRKPNLDGTWYTNGNRSMSCSISQKKNYLNLTNESGATATGFVSGDRSITTYWSGNRIDGTISPNGNTIYWNNGTSWSR